MRFARASGQDIEFGRPEPELTRAKVEQRLRNITVRYSRIRARHGFALREAR
jgi:hypothetical protein